MIKKCLGLLLAFTYGMSMAAAGDKVLIADQAPDSYTVRQGDTLWAISGIFLKHPWRWPEVWRLNQAQIGNPHLIFPGQVVVLDRSAQTLSMGRTVSRSADKTPYEKRSPQVYSASVETAISSVPLDAIRPFLSEPLVDDAPDDGTKPVIVAIQEHRVVAATGDTVFAKNLPDDTDAWQIYRRGSPIKDPLTKDVLGYEALFVASAHATSSADGRQAAALTIVGAKHEVSAGDRLTPAGKSDMIAFAPHAPNADTEGRVASIYDGVGVAGRYSVITVNLGANANLEPGHVLALYRNRGAITYRAEEGNEEFDLPDNRLGVAYVFRVFGRLSYALVMEAAEPVAVGDKVTAP